MQIVIADPKHLTPHPLHATIYGTESIAALIENIRDVGIQVPILVAPDYRIISGHRRWQAALSLALEEVVIQIHDATDEDEITKIMILSNKDNRERTLEQKANEVHQLKALKKGHKPVKTDEKNENLQNEGFPTEDGDWTKVVGKQLGISPMMAYRLDYAANTIDSLTADGKTQQAEEVRVALNKNAYAGYRKAIDLRPPKPQTSKKATPHRKGAALQEEARQRLGKHAPRRAAITTYDLMVKLFDQLTKSERALFFDFIQTRINLRVSVPTPPPETRH